jgi:hypothetical protein
MPSRRFGRWHRPSMFLVAEKLPPRSVPHRLATRRHLPGRRRPPPWSFHRWLLCPDPYLLFWLSRRVRPLPRRALGPGLFARLGAAATAGRQPPSGPSEARWFLCPDLKSSWWIGDSLDGHARRRCSLAGRLSHVLRQRESGSNSGKEMHCLA